MSKFDDRRKEDRKLVMKFTPVYEADNGKLLGYLRDLTLQGALVIGEKKLEVDTLLTLRFDLPDDLLNIAAFNLTVAARVARCIEDETPNSYQIGFEFKDIGLEQTEIIEALLERYHFRHRKFDWQDPGEI